MLFNSIEFIFVFLPVVIISYNLLKSDLIRKYFIICASVFFYGWWDPRYIALIAASIVGNYLIAVALRRFDRLKRHGILILGLTWNLSLLGFFKYFEFFAENLEYVFGLDYAIPAIILPLAISFFTFQQVAFLVDVYRGFDQRVPFQDYILFVIFFPQLIAGPIVHHSEMLPQFRPPGLSKMQLRNFEIGLFIASIGLLKKVLIADGLALYANEVFAIAGHQSLTFLEAWMGTLAFGLQIYFDFSAYSDIAIGVALFFGITLPINFLSPYKASSIIDFWRRWHITLSRFLRHYLYIPLGGNRKGEARRYLNILLVMLLGGLWHGAGWNFVLWGGLHGIYLALNHAWRAMTGIDNAGRSCRIGWIITFLCVTVAWVPFRAPDLSATLGLYQGMAGMNGLVLPFWISSNLQPSADLATQVLAPGALAFVAAALAIVLLLPNCYEIMSRFESFSTMANVPPVLAGLFRPGIASLGWSALALLVSLAFMLDEPSRFIYFQF